MVYLSRGTRSGFTLLEVLVAIAIVGMILTYLYSSFFLSKRVIYTVDDTLVRLQEMRMAIDIMRREMESAIFKRDKEYTVFKLEGKDIYGKDATSVTFTTFSHHTPGLIRVSYFVEGEDTLNLMKSVTSAVTSSNKVEEGRKEQIEVLDHIESFLVEAKYRDEWVKIWDSNLSKDIPKEVRLTIVMTIEGKRYTLSDVIRIRTGGKQHEAI